MYQTGNSMVATAKVFTTGNSQAVRLPKAFTTCGAVRQRWKNA